MSNLISACSTCIFPTKPALAKKCWFGYVWTGTGLVWFACFLAYDGINGWNFEFYERAGYIGYGLVFSLLVGLWEQCMLRVHDNEVEKDWVFWLLHNKDRIASMRMLENVGNSCQLLYHCKKHGFRGAVFIFTAFMVLRALCMFLVAVRLSDVSWREGFEKNQHITEDEVKEMIRSRGLGLKPVNIYTDLNNGELQFICVSIGQTFFIVMLLYSITTRVADDSIPSSLEEFSDRDATSLESYLKFVGSIGVFVAGSAVATLMRMREQSFFSEDGASEFFSFWVRYFKAHALDFTWKSIKACIRFLCSLTHNEWSPHLVWTLLPVVLMTIRSELDFVLNAVAIGFIAKLDDWVYTGETEANERLVPDVCTTELIKLVEEGKASEMQEMQRRELATKLAELEDKLAALEKAWPHTVAPPAPSQTM